MASCFMFCVMTPISLRLPWALSGWGNAGNSPMVEEPHGSPTAGVSGELGWGGVMASLSCLRVAEEHVAVGRVRRCEWEQPGARGHVSIQVQ